MLINYFEETVVSFILEEDQSRLSQSELSFCSLGSTAVVSMEHPKSQRYEGTEGQRKSSVVKLVEEICCSLVSELATSSYSS